ncbi:MAG: hypothetical protein K0B10_04140 [Vicingaceae bacterium]|nr:hypothetical protein [Vicingaceae bacterium]
MKKYIIILFSIISVNLAAQSQLVMPFAGKSFTTDQFGYYYEISDVEIKKYSNKGKLQYTYSNNLLGEITSIDVFNPMKILVYFKEFTKIITLDNTLSPTSSIIDLTTLDIDETSLVCRSYNDGIWYYNPIRFELIRKNNELITTNKSAQLANLLNKNIQPNFLVEYNNQVYLNDPKVGILVFDNFGTYIKTLPIFGLTEFQVKEKYLLFVNEKNEIMTYDFFTLENLTYKKSTVKEIHSVRIEQNHIYIINKKNELFLDKIN